MKPEAARADPRAILLVGILVALSGGLAVREVVGPGPRFGALINGAEQARARGDAEAALAALQRVAEARPESAKDRMRLGRALVETEPLEAADHFRQAAALDTTGYRYHWELAKALARGGSSQEAWDAVHAVLSAKPDHADALMLAAALTASEGHLVHTLGLWIAALENGPSDPDRVRWDPRFDPVRGAPHFVEAVVALRVPGTFVPEPEDPIDGPAS